MAATVPVSSQALLPAHGVVLPPPVPCPILCWARRAWDVCWLGNVRGPDWLPVIMMFVPRKSSRTNQHCPLPKVKRCPSGPPSGDARSGMASPALSLMENCLTSRPAGPVLKVELAKQKITPRWAASPTVHNRKDLQAWCIDCVVCLRVCFAVCGLLAYAHPGVSTGPWRVTHGRLCLVAPRCKTRPAELLSGMGWDNAWVGAGLRWCTCRGRC